ncbi:MAG TPA: hypothetical protein VH327_04340 [Gammaproteobacteria bacterium]|jgi:peptidoglycan/LPS O-acetylase OafA/YrhL|nr:hypothetical protein [Gammaproteobacteria bacterium]
MHDSHVLVFIHIFGGCLAIITGFLALFLRKGSRGHRRAGGVFVISMLIMSAIATYMAYVGTEVKGPNMGNVMGGSMAFYLVLTGWLTARHKDGEKGPLDWAAFLAITALGVALVFFSFSPDPVPAPTDEPPHKAALVFVAVAFLCSALDLRMLIWGLHGAQRIARHLWRMSLALWFAASSFFIGQPQVFPMWLHRTHLLFAPSLVILVAMTYWLVRTLRGGRRAGRPATVADASP